MNHRIKYLLLFPLIALRNFRRLLKNLLHFTEYAASKERIRKLGFSNGLPTADIWNLVPNLNEEIKSLTFLDDTSRVIDIALLRALAKRFNACAYLEIGSLRGESILNVAPLCGTVVSVTLGREEMRAMNFSENYIAMEGFLLNEISNLNRIYHNSLTYNFDSLEKKFDLIFVDGDHSYEGVRSDTNNVFKLLKDENSIIVWHDCGNSYEDQRFEVIAGILDGATQEQRKHIYRVSNSMCGIYFRSEINVGYPQISRKPEYVFDLKVQMRGL